VLVQADSYIFRGKIPEVNSMDFIKPVETQRVEAKAG